MLFAVISNFDRLVRYLFVISGKTLICCFPVFICLLCFEFTTNNSFSFPFCYFFFLGMLCCGKQDSWPSLLLPGTSLVFLGSFATNSLLSNLHDLGRASWQPSEFFFLSFFFFFFFFEGRGLSYFVLRDIALIICSPVGRPLGHHQELFFVTNKNYSKTLGKGHKIDDNSPSSGRREHLTTNFIYLLPSPNRSC